MMNKFLAKFKIKKQSKSLKVSNMVNPHHHWIVLLVTFLFVTSLLIVFSLYLLYQIKNEQIFKAKPVTNQEVSPIREKLLNSVTDYFDQKAEKEKGIKGNTNSYEDPSL